MPRARKRRLFPVAVSPAEAADVLGVRHAEIYEALRSGELRAYVKGLRSFVLVEDLVSLVRTWPLWPARKRKRRKSHEQPESK